MKPIVTSIQTPWGEIFQAYDDRFDEASPVGVGQTEAEAIADLEWQLEELENNG